MLSPVNKRLWSYAGERLVDIKLIAGQFGANRILDRVDSGETANVFLLPFDIGQALTLEIFNYFALDGLFRNAGFMPLSVVISHSEDANANAIRALLRHFDCRVLRDVIDIDAVIRIADLLKWDVLSRSDTSSRPPSWYLMLAAFVADVLAKQPALFVLYRSQTELIQVLTRSLPKAVIHEIGFVVLEDPDDRHLALGCPDDSDAFSRAIRKLRTGTSDALSHRISTCETYRTLFHYDQHGPGTFSSERLDSCYSSGASCSTCKQDIANHLIENYRRATGAKANHA